MNTIRKFALWLGIGVTAGLATAGLYLFNTFQAKRLKTAHQPRTPRSEQLPSAATTTDQTNPTATWMTFTSREYRYKFRYPSDFRTYSAVFGTQAKLANDLVDVFSPDTRISEGLGTPISGIEIRVEMLLDSKAEAEEPSRLLATYKTNPPTFDSSLIPSEAILSSDASAIAYEWDKAIDRPYMAIDFSLKRLPAPYAARKAVLQFVCMGEPRTCRTILPQVASTVEFPR